MGLRAAGLALGAGAHTQGLAPHGPDHAFNPAERGFVSIEKAGRSARYTPLVSREAYLAAQSRSFLDKLCGGKLSVLAAALCDSGLSREEIEELRGLLERDEL